MNATYNSTTTACECNNGYTITQDSNYPGQQFCKKTCGILAIAYEVTLNQSMLSPS
jgi:hypothetical protein